VYHGRRDLAETFSQAYFQVSGDDEGRVLLPFYSAYRAVVRGKVEGFELAEKEIPESERVAAVARARAHWLLALGELEEPNRKPCLILVGGLPGTGKSTLARSLAKRANFDVIRSDLVRKELANRSSDIQQLSAFEEGIYAPEWTARTYAECLRRAEQLLFEGKRVLVDASFRQEEQRRRFLETAVRWAVPGIFLHCQAEPEIVQQRLRDRRGDASDADWSIYLQKAQRWEETSLRTRQAEYVITNGSPENTIAQALTVLRGFRLGD
jgi:predicted kinase